MPEWLKSLIAAIGGGAVVLVAALTVFKEVIIKLFETVIESSLEKNMEKFKNRLERSTRAYEILLEREMRFYSNLEPITAELVPLEHDLLYYLKYNENIEREVECETFRKKFLRYCELIKTLKNESLIHQLYVPQEIFSAFADVVKQLQDDSPYWSDMAKLLFSGEYDRIDFDEAKKIVDTLLMKLAFAETKVRFRLQQLSGDGERKSV